MKNKVANLFAFTLGVSIGSIITQQFLKKKYEQIAQEEIDSVKEMYSKKTTHQVPEDAAVEREEPIAPEELKKYENTVNGEGYKNYSDVAKKKTEEVENESMSEPYIIAPEEFGDHADYDTVSLTYYADGVLADDNNEVIENIDEKVGRDSLTHFGEYEDDSVFVRNDKLQCDYEILLDFRDYSEVWSKDRTKRKE